MNDSINYYELLGINNDATSEEIKQAYKSMIKKWHPDVNKDANASQMSVILNEAKVVLLDEIKRKEYDEYLKNKTYKTYENLKNRATKSKDQTDTHNKYYDTSAYQEAKTYTKWEYYHDYMKFYNSPIWLKILVSLGILLETLICSILQILNFILAFLFSITYSILAEILNYILGLFILAIIIGAFSHQITEIKDWINIGLVFFITMLIVSLPELIITFLTEKMPYYLSSLNILLFKKCVGYKN